MKQACKRRQCVAVTEAMTPKKEVAAEAKAKTDAKIKKEVAAEAETEAKALTDAKAKKGARKECPAAPSTAPNGVGLVQQMKQIKEVLSLDESLPLLSAVKEANMLVFGAEGSKEPLAQQVLVLYRSLFA